MKNSFNKKMFDLWLTADEYEELVVQASCYDVMELYNFKCDVGFCEWMDNVYSELNEESANIIIEDIIAQAFEDGHIEELTDLLGML